MVPYHRGLGKSPRPGRIYVAGMIVLSPVGVIVKSSCVDSVGNVDHVGVNSTGPRVGKLPRLINHTTDRMWKSPGLCPIDDHVSNCNLAGVGFSSSFAVDGFG